MDTKLSRVIIAQFYVAKGLEKNPAKIIKFIMDNKNYFPHADNELINKIKLEYNLTDEDIEKEQSLIFTDLKTEEIHEAELKAKANKIKIIREEEAKRRNFGYGNRSKMKPEQNSPDIALEEANEQFAKLKVNLRQEFFVPEPINK